MSTEELTLNRSVALGSAVIYWSGVWVQTRRVRQRIGRSPNVKPRGLKERLLWIGWAFVVMAWLTLPFASGERLDLAWFSFLPSLVHPIGSVLGITLMVLGYAGTLWCYRAMGDAWRMGISRNEQTQLVTNGPYRLVRHPIYLFQIVMVAAMFILLPSVFSGLVLGLHLLCVLIKAADEEKHLRTLLGQNYAGYRARTGAWFPPLCKRNLPAQVTERTNQEHLRTAEHTIK